MYRLIAFFHFLYTFNKHYLQIEFSHSHVVQGFIIVLAFSDLLEIKYLFFLMTVHYIY